MLKQHCEICDGVIPPVESYKTVHFGRGSNPNINVGFDPMVICKRCWNKMMASVGMSTEGIDEQVDKASEKTIAKRQERADALESEITDFLVNMAPDNVAKMTGKDKSCESCIYGNSPLDQAPCCTCTGKDKWEGKS